MSAPGASTPSDDDSAAAPPGGGAVSGAGPGPGGLGDLAAEGIEIDILPDGMVRLHARCQPGQDPAECAERVRFLVEALGVPLDGVVTEVSPPPDADG